MRAIARLHPRERVMIDTMRLAGHGLAGAQVALLEDLARWLYHFDASRRAGDCDALAARAEGVARLAAGLGMTTLAEVADAATGLCRSGPSPAAAAVSARLTRVGEQSLVAAWDGPGAR